MYQILHNMFLMTMVNIVNNNEQTYIQLRDENMRLLGFFHRNGLHNYIKNENLGNIQQQIEEILQTAVPGKLYYIKM